MNKISIIGAGGHTRSSLNVLFEFYPNAQYAIYDNNFDPDKEEFIHGIKLAGKIKDIDDESMIFLSVGDNQNRKMLYEQFRNRIIVENLIHPSSIVEQHVKLGKSNLILANTYLNSYTQIGENNLINTGAILEHETIVGSHNHISVGARLCGRVRVGNNCMIGAGAVIIDKISICDNVIIGAGAVVIRNITEPGTYVGNPARKIK